MENRLHWLAAKSTSLLARYRTTGQAIPMKKVSSLCSNIGATLLGLFPSWKALLNNRSSRGNYKSTISTHRWGTKDRCLGCSNKLVWTVRTISKCFQKQPNNRSTSWSKKLVKSSKQGPRKSCSLQDFSVTALKLNETAKHLNSAHWLALNPSTSAIWNRRSHRKAKSSFRSFLSWENSKAAYLASAKPRKFW